MKYNSKERSQTTQHAPLEKLLSIYRYRRLNEIYKDKRVLDFGCGLEAWSVKSMAKKAHVVHGVDASLPGIRTISDNACLFPSTKDLPHDNYDLIVALAVFEHIPPFDLVSVLADLYKLSHKDALIFGTVPTPLARPLLELLALRLRLIDSSQILDHWVYYDDLWLSEIVALSEWQVISYKKFQFGLNSQFLLAKK